MGWRVFWHGKLIGLSISSAGWYVLVSMGTVGVYLIVRH